jgi:hypothetical protein
MKKSLLWTLTILIEILCGALLGFSYIKIIMGYGVTGDSYFSSIFNFYGVLSLIFFLVVLTIGIFASNRLNKSHNLSKAIYFAIIFWIISIVFYVISFEYFSYKLNSRILPIFIILIGIIIGFNIGLSLRNKKT